MCTCVSVCCPGRAHRNNGHSPRRGWWVKHPTHPGQALLEASDTHSLLQRHKAPCRCADEAERLCRAHAPWLVWVSLQAQGLRLQACALADSGGEWQEQDPLRAGGAPYRACPILCKAPSRGRLQGRLPALLREGCAGARALQRQPPLQVPALPRPSSTTWEAPQPSWASISSFFFKSSPEVMLY